MRPGGRSRTDSKKDSKKNPKKNPNEKGWTAFRPFAASGGWVCVTALLTLDRLNAWLPDMPERFRVRGEGYDLRKPGHPGRIRTTPVTFEETTP